MGLSFVVDVNYLISIVVKYCYWIGCGGSSFKGFVGYWLCLVFFG